MRVAARKFQLRFAAAALSLACGTTGCGQHSSRQGLPQPDHITLVMPVSVAMESAGGRPVVTARVNGRGPYKLILDSGAAGSVFSNELARDLALPDLGHAKIGRPESKDTQPATLTKIEKIEIAGLRLEGVSAVCADLSMVQKRLASDVQGVLSATMLDDVLVAYDYPARKIGFRRGELPAADGQTVFDWPAGERLPSVMMELAGEAVRVDIDTGSGNGFIITQAMAAKLEWLETPVAAGPMHTLDTVTQTAAGRMKGEIRIGKFVFANPQVRTNDGVMKTVGYEVLKNFVFTLDPKNRRFELRRE